MSIEQRNPEDEISNSAKGRDVITVFAFGCIEQMLERDLPFTEQGFEQLVQISRNTGLNGRIAFQIQAWTHNKLKEIMGADLFGSEMNEDRLAKFRSKPSLRQRMLRLGMGRDDSQLTQEQKNDLLDWFADYLGGDDVKVILRALIAGDCQRDLVWMRMSEIVSDGNVKAQLDLFKEAS